MMGRAIQSKALNKTSKDIKQLRENQNRLYENQNRMREEQGVLKELGSPSKGVAVVLVESGLGCGSTN